MRLMLEVVYSAGHARVQHGARISLRRCERQAGRRAEGVSSVIFLVLSRRKGALARQSRRDEHLRLYLKRGSGEVSSWEGRRRGP